MSHLSDMETPCGCSFKSDLASFGAGFGRDCAVDVRFAVGDRVRCKTEDNEWCSGTVVGVRYHQADWPEDVIIPYQVEIDDGLLIYVPRDVDEICQRIEKAWWQKALHHGVPANKSMFDSPGQYLVVSNTMVSDALNRRNSTKIADAMPPANFDILEVEICEDRIRGRVAEPAGWISLRSVDNEKIFAVPSKSAFASRFRYVNKSLFLDDMDTDDDSLQPCQDYGCQQNSTCDSHQGLCVDSLLKHSVGQDINERDECAQTALIMSVKAGCLDAVQRLLALNADVNLGDCHGETALHNAVRIGQEEILRTLLQAQADPNIQSFNPNVNSDRKSKTFAERELHQAPIHLAVKLGSTSLVRELMLAEANPNLRDAESKVPLHVALDTDSEEMVNALIDLGADVNIGHSGIGVQTTLLQDAAYRNDVGLVQKLLAARAEMNAVDKHGMTALHIAIRSRREGIAQLLIESGCDATIALPGTGKTAADLAQSNGMQNLLALLTK